MRKEDVSQVTEIDREAFPSLWPPTNYKRELGNLLAHYIVAYDTEKVVEKPALQDNPRKYLSGLARWLFSYKPSPSPLQYIVGFAGFWAMADEAHITSIAVWEIHKRKGIGELLLLSTVDLATELNTHFITLEVRASNIVAQSLYHKYGFNKVGLRRNYYTDNDEDAILMSCETITSAPFQARLHQLKQAHSRKWGIGLCQVMK